MMSARTATACMVLGLTGAAGANATRAVEVRDPFAYCERVGTADRPGVAEGGSNETSVKTLEPYLRAALGWDQSAALPTAGIFWRCMQGKVYVCAVGANLPCGAKADTAKRNRGAETYCRAHPAAADVPAFATGHETLYAWRCAGARAVRGAPVALLDPRGYRRDLWHVVNR